MRRTQISTSSDLEAGVELNKQVGRFRLLVGCITLSTVCNSAVIFGFALAMVMTAINLVSIAHEHGEAFETVENNIVHLSENMATSSDSAHAVVLTVLAAVNSSAQLLTHFSALAAKPHLSIDFGSETSG